MENLSGGCCDCHCCDCDWGKTKSTPSLGFRLRLEFDKNLSIILNKSEMAHKIFILVRCLFFQNVKHLHCMYVCIVYGMWILRYPYWSTQCKAGLSLVDMLKGIWQAALTSLFWSLAELDLGSSCTRHWVPHFSLCGIDKEFSLTDWDGKNILRK